MKRLRKSEIRELTSQLPIPLPKKAEVMLEDNVLLVNGKLSFFTHPSHSGWIPALPLLLEQDVLPVVTVDMGAVRFVTRGADIMRPGITKMADFGAGDLVVIQEETHGKPLAVGIAGLSAVDIRSAIQGNVITNLHHIGDDLWTRYG